MISGLEKAAEERPELIDRVMRRAISALSEEPQQLSPDDLRRVFTDASGNPYGDWLYELILYAKGEFDKTGKKRFCGNPIFVHTLGTMLRVHEQTAQAYSSWSKLEDVLEHEHRDVVLAAAALHDLREDCPVPRRDLKARLEYTKAPHTDYLLKATDTLTKKSAKRRAITHVLRMGASLLTPVNELLSKKPEFNERRYKVYINRIFRKAYEGFNAGDPLHDAAVIAKLADAIDNLETVPQVAFNPGLYERVLRKTVMIKHRARNFAETTQNPFVALLIERLERSESSLETYLNNELGRGINGLNNYVQLNQPRAPDLPARYTGTVSAAIRDVNSLLRIIGAGRNGGPKTDGR